MVIFITKTTQILEILYPDAIPIKHVEETAEKIKHITPIINNLVVFVDSDKSIYTIGAPSALKMSDKIADEKPGHKKEIKSDEDDKKDKRFIESERYLVDESWREIGYNESVHMKKDDCIRIKGDGCQIDTTWQYLNDYYQSLPDTVAIIHIDGLNKKKQKTLAKFYEDHPNFQCHIDKFGGLNSLIKDEVHVSVKTTHDDAGTVDPEHYGE